MSHPNRTIREGSQGGRDLGSGRWSGSSDLDGGLIPEARSTSSSMNYGHWVYSIASVVPETRLGLLEYS